MSCADGGVVAGCVRPVGSGRRADVDHVVIRVTAGIGAWHLASVGPG
ncbi:hypothetical protein ACFQZ8_01420 [Micromonospora azadirachtae]|uniref:Uncharacterized protein n=1 Tax=Micromonospora azadirachtae TaxID=1970735 RepID=A0ABW2ZVB2_9ACTN